MRKFLSVAKLRFDVKSYLFTLVLSLYFAFVLNLSFWRFVIRYLEITNAGMAWFLFSLPFFVFAPLYIVFNILSIPYLAKPISISLLLVSSSANYFMYVYGVFIDADMITNVFETTKREAHDLTMFSFAIWVFITGVIPSVIILFVKIEYQSFKKEIKIRILSILLSIAIVGFFVSTSFKEYVSFGRNNKEIRKLLNTVNYIYSSFRYFQLKASANREFTILDKNARKIPCGDSRKTVLIFIVGETARAQNFSLDGYKRDTNPLLSKQDIIYNKMFSCGTSTAVSLPCMFSSENREDFKKDNAKYTENLLDIIGKSGYDILWKDNDDGCKNVCNRVNTEYMIDTNNPKYCFGKYCQDESLLEGLEDKMRSIENDTVIVLHTMGSHGPTYYNRYPDKFRKFTPTCDTADIQNCSKDAIVNTYDNTIVYTDYIVSSAIDLLKKFPQLKSSLIYISDHGESLGENNIYLHGLPYKIAPSEQKEVPFVFWMSENMKKYDDIDYDCMTKEASIKKYSHDNIFHSVIGLLKIDTTLYDKEFDIFQSCRRKEQ